MKKKHTTSEKCIYCDKKAGSEEHVFPQWLRKRFTGSGTLEHKVNISDPVRFKRRIHDVRITVRSVCKKCNTGWMSDLQKLAKPIIEGLLDETTTSLSLQDCRTLTCWCVMTVMCLETRNESSVWLYKALDRTLFYTHKEIPENTEVWLAYWKDSPGPFFEGTKGEAKDSEGHVSTFGFGNVVFQVLHLVPNDKPQPNRITIQPPWDEILIPIRYPKESEIAWIPKQGLNSEFGFTALQSRFSLSPITGVERPGS
jgi:hypothetical protein